MASPLVHHIRLLFNHHLIESKFIFQVILKVDTVTLTVFMTTGTLMIQGNHVLDWFLRQFQSIMDNYDAPVKEQKPTSEAFKQYTESWKKMEDETALRKGKYKTTQAFSDISRTNFIY